MPKPQPNQSRMWQGLASVLQVQCAVFSQQLFLFGNSSAYNDIIQDVILNFKF